MRKLLLGAGILAIFAIGTNVLALKFEREIALLADDVVKTSAFMTEGRESDAEKQLVDSLTKWLEMERFTSVFINHSKIDAVTDAYYDYLGIISSSLDDEALRDKLIYHLSDTASMEKLSFGTIF